MSATYRLRYFFDAGSGTCLWAGNDAARERWNYAVDHDELPLTLQTRERADAAIKRYDTGLGWSDPAGPSPWNDAEAEAFAIASQGLLEAFRAELGADFEIVDGAHALPGPSS